MHLKPDYILGAPGCAGASETRDLAQRDLGAAHTGCGSLAAHLDAIRKFIGGAAGVSVQAVRGRVRLRPNQWHYPTVWMRLAQI